MRKTAFLPLTPLLMLFLGGAALGSSGQKPDAAEELYNAGYLLSLLGAHEQALALYDDSLAIRPTAEAYTFKGWTLGQMGQYHRAIEEAQKAIRLDPEFGNPYNDIGVYLIELGREDEALAYLEKAKTARRYCCYQYPHFNLGRVYLKKRLYEKAREEFKKALEIDPQYGPAQAGLQLLKELGIEA
ncbi:MAG TPA: tetratricopeptide repeat protein [candidate division Zixibacteria bacterium]|nr:tetratricopeptide repeat protein [candidate division Zixibacteria bacterium]